MCEQRTIMIDDVEYVRSDKAQAVAEPVDGMQYCIIRCCHAGVHAGFVKERDGQEVTLLKTRRLWRWHGKTLSGLATEGTTNVDSCKYSPEIPEIQVLDACEIIPCTEAGIKSIREEVPAWKND